LTAQEQYEKETGKKALYRIRSSDYHTLKYVTWLEARNCALLEEVKELQDLAIWMTGCGYDFCQLDYFCKQRDKLLKA